MTDEPTGTPAEDPVDPAEPGNDDQLEAEGQMEDVQEANDAAAHADGEEEIVTSNTEPEDDGLPDAE